MVKSVFLDLFIIVNAKTNEKAEKVAKSVQLALNSPLYISEIYLSDTDEYTIQCHIMLNDQEISKAVLEALFILNKLGKDWQVKAPIIGDEYWVFNGSRNLSHGMFSVNGLRAVDFTLTDHGYERAVNKTFPI